MAGEGLVEKNKFRFIATCGHALWSAISITSALLIHRPGVMVIVLLTFPKDFMLILVFSVEQLMENF
jgi:hypothetical protein